MRPITRAAAARIASSVIVRGRGTGLSRWSSPKACRRVVLDRALDLPVGFDPPVGASLCPFVDDSGIVRRGSTFHHNVIRRRVLTTFVVDPRDGLTKDSRRGSPRFASG